MKNFFKKFQLAGLCFLSVLVMSSCGKKVFDVNGNELAGDKVVQDIKNKKIVFIGENQSDTLSIRFLTDNIEDFYNAGVRYLLTEGGFERLYNPDGWDFKEDYNFNLLYPWMKGGKKYEQEEFQLAVEKLNKKHADDPLIVKCLTEGFELSLDEQLGMTKAQSLQLEDDFVLNNILEVEKSSKENDKILIYYGPSHGSKNEQDVPGGRWVPFGCSLSDMYGDNYTNYYLETLLPNKKLTLSYKNESDCVIASEENLNVLGISKGLRSNFDNFCVSFEENNGTNYQYVGTKENLNFLYTVATKWGKDNKEFWEKGSWTYKSMVFNAIYYLKYYYGDLFPYEVWSSETTLADALKSLESNMTEDEKWAELIITDFSIDEMKKYNKYLYCNKNIENFIQEKFEKKGKHVQLNNLNETLDSLRKAKEINNYDIWPQYWIAYFETEQAMRSKENDDFITAINDWNELLENDLVYDSPVLPLVYDRLAICSDKANDGENASKYRKMRDDLSNEFGFDIRKLIDVGY